MIVRCIYDQITFQEKRADFFTTLYMNKKYLHFKIYLIAFLMIHVL